MVAHLHETFTVMLSTWCIDPHLLVAQEDIIQEDHVADVVNDSVPQDQPRIIERPNTVFVEQKGYNAPKFYNAPNRILMYLIIIIPSVH